MGFADWRWSSTTSSNRSSAAERINNTYRTKHFRSSSTSLRSFLPLEHSNQPHFIPLTTPNSISTPHPPHTIRAKTHTTTSHTIHPARNAVTPS
ncbi:hypothetical protein BCR33DRAFT_713763, partial [Rhizoclosmatium globosum]